MTWRTSSSTSRHWRFLAQCSYHKLLIFFSRVSRCWYGSTHVLICWLPRIASLLLRVNGETTTTENEKSSATSTPQPSGLGELAATATAPAGRGQGAVQRVQVGSAPGADKSEVSREGASRRSSPTPATRPIKYALEIWVELEVSPGVYGAPEDDSYGIDFAAETLNPGLPRVYGLYTWMWPAIWWPSMGGRAIPRRASCMNRVFKLVRPSPRSPPGWDALPPGGCGVSV